MKHLTALLRTACVIAYALGAAPGAWADTPAALTADQILAKNAAARGGLDAWRKVQTMVWSGHIQSAHAPVPDMPFVLEMQRPNKTHFEIKAHGEAAMRIFDGAHGWKLHPTYSGRPELLPYTAEELSFAKDAQGIDGPLLDHEAKGIAVSLDGMEEVEGHKAYRLNIKLPSGTRYHLWLDAATFLEIKYDRQLRNAAGQLATTSVFYRDYRNVAGLQVPFTIETRSGAAGAGGASDKMVIDRIVLNPPLTDLAFARPALFGRSNAAAVDIPPQPPGQSAQPGFPKLNRPASAQYGAGR